MSDVALNHKKEQTLIVKVSRHETQKENRRPSSSGTFHRIIVNRGNKEGKDHQGRQLCIEIAVEPTRWNLHTDAAIRDCTTVTDAAKAML